MTHKINPFIVPRAEPKYKPKGVLDPDRQAGYGNSFIFSEMRVRELLLHSEDQ